MTDYMQQGAPMPASIGRCADLYRDVRDVRLAMEKEVERVKAREAEIREHIIATLSTSDDTGAAGLRYRAQIVPKTHYRIAVGDETQANGWGVFTSWIRKNDRFDMLQKRINEKAVAEWCAENNRVVPGLERLIVKDVSITKI